MLREVADAGGDVISVDWHVGIDEAWKIIGHDRAIQGNLDPTVLFAPQPFIGDRVADVLRRAGGHDGHIFNLGHGLMPAIPPENVGYAVERVHALSKRSP